MKDYNFEILNIGYNKLNTKKAIAIGNADSSMNEFKVLYTNNGLSWNETILNNISGLSNTTNAFTNVYLKDDKIYDIIGKFSCHWRILIIFE